MRCNDTIATGSGCWEFPSASAVIFDGYFLGEPAGRYGFAGCGRTYALRRCVAADRIICICCALAKRRGACKKAATYSRFRRCPEGRAGRCLSIFRGDEFYPFKSRTSSVEEWWSGLSSAPAFYRRERAQATEVLIPLWCTGPIQDITSHFCKPPLRH